MTAYKETFAAISGLDYWWELDGDETDSMGGADSDGGIDPAWVDSIVPNAAEGIQCGDYDGSAKTLIPNRSDINSGVTTQKSIWAWVEADSLDTTGNGRPIWHEGGPVWGLGLYVYDGSLYFDLYHYSTHDTISWSGISTGSVYLITAVIDFPSGEMYLYVNGAMVASKTGGLNNGTSFPAHVAGVSIGGVDVRALNHNDDTMTGFFDGRIADVGYVAEGVSVLSDHQAVYSAGTDSPTPPPSGIFRPGFPFMGGARSDENEYECRFGQGAGRYEMQRGFFTVTSILC